MKPHEIILLTILGLYLSIKIPIEVISSHRKQKNKEQEIIKDFLRMLLAEVHEGEWILKQKNSSKDELIKQFTKKLESRLWTSFCVVMRIDRLPKTCDYPMIDTKLLDDIMLVLRDIHSRYRQKKEKLSDLKAEFFLRIGKIVSEQY